MAHFIPTYTQVSAIELAHLLFQEVWRLHEMPTNLVLDKDPGFTFNVGKELMSIAGTQLKMSSTRHPQSDGQTERLNKVLEVTLRCFIHPRQDD